MENVYCSRLGKPHLRPARIFMSMRLPGGMSDSIIRRCCSDPNGSSGVSSCMSPSTSATCP